MISCDEVVEIVVMSQGALAKLDQVEAFDTIWGWHVPTSTCRDPQGGEWVCTTIASRALSSCDDVEDYIQCNRLLL